MRIDRWASTNSVELVSVILPVFNEARTVENTLDQVHSILSKSEFNFEIIVVESNSSDGSREIVRQSKAILNRSVPDSVKLVLQDEAKGKGSAVREGLVLAKGDVIAIYDADDEYKPGDIIRLIKVFEKSESSFILGTRHAKGSPMRVMVGHPILSKLMNLAHWLFTFIFNMTFRVNLTDPFTMHKVFNSKIFENANLVADRFDIDWEILGTAIRLGSVPQEIPIEYQARSYSEGKKVRIFLDPAKWIVILIKVRFRRFRPNSR
jgi:glycosyltransferase involved in cell wall biosynthesis